MAALIRIMGDVERVYALDASTSIGREAGNVIAIEDPLVSRQHAALEVDAAGAWTIVDRGSLHGTFVQRRRVERQALADGDEIFIGATRFYFRADRAGVAGAGRRWEERVGCDLPVVLLREEGTPCPARVLDLSCSGLRLHCEQVLAIAESLRLTLTFPGGVTLPLRVRVMHYNPATRTAGGLCLFEDGAEHQTYALQVVALMRQPA